MTAPIPFLGRVHAQLDTQPFVLTIPMDGHSLSSEHVDTLIPRTQLSEHLSLADLGAIFSMGQTLTLQIEPEDQSFPVALVKGYVKRFQESAGGALVSFGIEGSRAELDDLVSAMAPQN